MLDINETAAQFIAKTLEQATKPETKRDWLGVLTDSVPQHPGLVDSKLACQITRIALTEHNFKLCESAVGTLCAITNHCPKLRDSIESAIGAISMPPATVEARKKKGLPVPDDIQLVFALADWKAAAATRCGNGSKVKNITPPSDGYACAGDQVEALVREAQRTVGMDYGGGFSPSGRLIPTC
ncbi:MAG: hypothetical protein WDO70_08430 [Alphaproteobacteria bacterium]